MACFHLLWNDHQQVQLISIFLYRYNKRKRIKGEIFLLVIRTLRICSLNDAPICHLAGLAISVLPFVTSWVPIPIRGPRTQDQVVPDEGNGSLQLPGFLGPRTEICNQKVAAITTSVQQVRSSACCCLRWSLSPHRENAELSKYHML